MLVAAASRDRKGKAMPPLRLTKGIIERACELRAYGGSDGACARHAGVSIQTFCRWLHFGQMLRDYLDNNQTFDPPETYRTWRKEAVVVQEKLKRELEQTGGALSKEHRAYLKLWDGMVENTDVFVQQCQQTIDMATKADPAWALRGLRWFNPQEYLSPAEQMLQQAQNEAAGDAEAVGFDLPIGVIAPSFIDAYDDIKDHAHTEYVFYGGRGSTKSSFVSLIMIWMIKNYSSFHLLCLRQVKDTLRDSVYSQLQWAISELGLEDQFKCTVSPLEITYIPTGQKIYFRGADEPGKIKSIKPPFGYIGGVWFEELDQFKGPEAVRKIEQSAIRGGDIAFIFKTFNPPRTANNWANQYVRIPKENQFQHRSTYLELGGRVRWLGKAFVDEAEHLKRVNPAAYEHEYLGVANGVGSLVFENVQLRKIDDEEIAQFDRILWGGDWGFYPDPADFGPVHYDAARRILYVFGEYRVWKQSNLDLYRGFVRKFNPGADAVIIADSAEPKSVADLRKYAADGVEMLDENGNPVLDSKGKPVLIYGPSCRGAEKGPDSVAYSIKWLQGLTAIVIDPERAPYAAEEFLNYEYERDADDNVISEYPDKNNHAIDRVRYATNLIWRRRGQ